MIALSRLVNLEFNSRWLRNILSLFYKSDRFYRIWFGPMAGKKLYYTPEINYHAVIGAWEVRNFKTLSALIRHGIGLHDNAVILDVGANIGMYTLFFKKYLGKRCRIYAFEPSPDALHLLKKNLTANNISGEVHIVEKAVSDSKGQVEFFIGHHHVSSLFEEWTSGGGQNHTTKITVPAITLDDYCAENNLKPDFIKVDIEGGGIYALPGAYKTIAATRPIVLIESHNKKEDHAVIDLINTMNYSAYRVSNRKWVLELMEDFTHPDGVYGTMILCPSERVDVLKNCLS